MPGISEIDPSLEDVRTAHIAEVVCQLICRQCPGIKTEIACGQRDASIEGERWVLRKIWIAVGKGEFKAVHARHEFISHAVGGVPAPINRQVPRRAISIHGIRCARERWGAAVDGIAQRILVTMSPAHKDAVSVDRKSTRLNSSHGYISYAVFCLKKKKQE